MKRFIYRQQVKHGDSKFEYIIASKHRDPKFEYLLHTSTRPRIVQVERITDCASPEASQD